MFEIFKKEYYIDIDAISEKCQVQNKNYEDENDNGELEEKSVLEINIFKYEIIKMCIDRIFVEYDDEEEDEIFKEKNISTPFKIAFNTLINYEIIKENYE